jgi:succinyl-CoA synthetase alpha subunit
LVDAASKVIVQGITGTQGSFHSKLMQEYGTKIVAGTSPGKGSTIINNIPVYDTLREAKERHVTDTSIIFVPALFAAEAAYEAIENKIKTIVIITEHMPIKDTIMLLSHAKKAKTTIIGPNTPGVISPGKCLLGIMPSHIFRKGNIGLVSRSGTLTYEIAAALTRENIGQSTCVGIGGDPITGLNFIDILKRFKEDPQTQIVVMIGEIGGNIEELTARYIIEEKYPKPVVAYIAGRTAPTGKRMGHAGAIIMGKTGTAASKIEALEAAGVKIAQKPNDVPKLVAQMLSQ